MGLAGLIKADLIEWMSVMTYQSASGAGAKQVRELIAQSAYISQHLSADELTSSGSVLPLVNKVSELINSAGMPVENFGVPLMGSIIPVSYTHLTLPTIYSVKISVVADSLKKK